MAKHTHWAELWWSILQEFGKECYRTAVKEVISTLAGGVAGALIDWLRSHGHSSFTDALYNGALGAGVVFVLYAIVNLFRSVWLEHKTADERTTMQGIGGAIVVLIIMCSIGLGVFLSYVSFRSDLTLSAPADLAAKNAEIAQWKAKYESAVAPESPTSLRRRVWKLADEVGEFWDTTFRRRPTQDPAMSPDKYQTINQDYFLNAEQQCRRKFLERTTGIVQQLKAAGVNTRTEWGGADLATVVDRCLGQQEVIQLRELGYHVDAQGLAIRPAF
jgi:hypothetical protein